MNAFRDGRYTYIPIIGVKPAEMRALEEIPGREKSIILPYIVFRPWTNAHKFESVSARVGAACGNRPIIADLTTELFDGKLHDVHNYIAALRNSSGGYAAWCQFIEENELYIPSLQLRDASQLRPQIARLAALGRGIVVRLTEFTLPFAEAIATTINEEASKCPILFILDFQKQSRELLTKVAGAIEVARKIRKILPTSVVSSSASTFPTKFAGLTDQDIYERLFFNEFSKHIGEENSIYCDRASVRAESQEGGGGQPAPRIDNAIVNRWEFFREPDEEDKFDAYQKAAERAVKSSNWADLGVWGTEYIKKTANGDPVSIDTAQKSTSARINIHIYVQSKNSSAIGVAEDEEPWED